MESTYTIERCDGKSIELSQWLAYVSSRDDIDAPNPKGIIRSRGAKQSAVTISNPSFAKWILPAVDTEKRIGRFSLRSGRLAFWYSPDPGIDSYVISELEIIAKALGARVITGGGDSTIGGVSNASSS